MKRILSTIFYSSAAAVGLAVSPAIAQNTNYAPGDLVLAFQKEGNSNTVYVALGNTATLYRGAAAGAEDGVNRIKFLNIGAELASAFGSGWASDTSIYAGLAGVWGTSTTNAVALQNGDPHRTLYISGERQSVGTVGSPNSNQWDMTLAGNTAMTSASSGIQSQNLVLETSYTNAVEVSPTSVSQIDEQNPFLSPGIQGPAMSDVLEGGIQQAGTATSFGTFGEAGSVEFALDLYRVLAINTASGQVGGDVRMGSYEGTVTVDANGNVSFIAQAGVLAPEIDIEQPAGSGLSDGGSVDFPNTNVGMESVAKTFVIRNNGSADLTDLVFTISGTGTDEYNVTPPVETSLAAGASTSFTVSFAPLALGARGATLQIASNDTDENPYDIQLVGAGSAASPEISVLNAAGSNLVDGTAQATYGSTAVGMTGSSQTFTIKNLGNANLIGLAVSKAGSHTADFSVSALGATLLAPGASTTVTVTFMPKAAGARSASLRIASNDADENPFDIQLAGSAFNLIPEIAVLNFFGTNLVDGTAKAEFGSAGIGKTGNSQTFTIKNLGNANLTGLAVSKAGSHVADFTFGALGATSLAPGATTTVKVTFTPKAVGARSASLRIASNDADENPFDIQLVGSGVSLIPEIAVLDASATNFVDGTAKVVFGSATIGKTGSSHKFTIKNMGNANLTGLAVSKAGSHITDFTVGALGATSLAPGATTTVTVTFVPKAVGARSAVLRIASNDANENPFDIQLVGTALAPVPEIDVQQPIGSHLVDAVTKKSFGTVVVGKSGTTKTFTIKNTGTANLTGLAVSKGGSHPADFTATQPTLITLAPGASTTFKVTFKPTVKGTRNAVVRIKSNDANENPFDVILTGLGALN